MTIYSEGCGRNREGIVKNSWDEFWKRKKIKGTGNIHTHGPQLKA